MTNSEKQNLNTDINCHCDWCNHGDIPVDDEYTIEMRLDIAEAALSGIRQHLWKLDYRLSDLYEWAKRHDKR